MSRVVCGIISLHAVRDCEIEVLIAEDSDLVGCEGVMLG